MVRLAGRLAKLTRASAGGIVRIVIAAVLAPGLASRRLLLLILLHSEQEPERTESGSGAHQALSAAFLARSGPAGTTATGAGIPRAVRVSPAAVTSVTLLLDDGLLAPLVAGSDAEDGQETVPQAAHDTACAQQQKQNNTGECADNDTRDRSSAQTGISRAATGLTTGRTTARTTTRTTARTACAAGCSTGCGSCRAAGRTVRGAVLGGVSVADQGAAQEWEVAGTLRHALAGVLTLLRCRTANAAAC